MMTRLSLICIFIKVGPGLPGPSAGHVPEWRPILMAENIQNFV